MDQQFNHVFTCKHRMIWFNYSS